MKEKIMDKIWNPNKKCNMLDYNRLMKMKDKVNNQDIQPNSLKDTNMNHHQLNNTKYHLNFQLIQTKSYPNLPKP